MANSAEVTVKKYTAKDFTSDQDVRWCPGCGDYSILAQVQRTFPEIIETNKENIVWVSGIGCSSRFPYCMDTASAFGPSTAILPILVFRGSVFPAFFSNTIVS